MTPTTIPARLALTIVAALSLRSVLLAGENAAAKSDVDPILRDLKTAASARWEPGFSPHGAVPPTLGISLTIRGTAVAQASAYGRVRLKSLIDQDGRSYRSACLTSATLRGDMTTVCAIGNRQDDAIRINLGIANRPPIRTIRELKGTLVLETGGDSEVLLIPNVFKGAAKPGKRNDADGDDWGTLIRGNNLSALDIMVGVSRRPADIVGAKDHACIKINSKRHAVTACDIVDTNGAQVPIMTWGRGGTGPDYDCDIYTERDLPSDARLRLTIRKNQREVRVPFEFKNVLVPAIAKDLDVPVTADNAFVEAGTLSPNDPLLAELKLAAKASWRPWQGNIKPADLVVEIELRGKAAERTSAFGELDIESATDESGKSVDFSNGEAMRSRFCDNDSFTIESVIMATSPVRKIRELRGTVAIQVGDHFQPVPIKDFAGSDRRKLTISNATLTSLGIVADLERKRQFESAAGGGESLRVDLRWKRNPVVRCDVFDASGKAFPAASWSLSTSPFEPRAATWWRSFRENLPQNAQLQLVVQRDPKKVRIPFNFKDIEIPARPAADAVQGVAAPGRAARPIPTAK